MRDTLIHERDFSRRIGKSTRTLARWRDEGSGPEYVRLGRTVYYPEAAAAKWIEARTYASTADEHTR